MCLRRDKPPKILRMSLGDSRDLAQTSSTARRMREASASARFDSGRVRRFDRPVAVSRLRDRGSVVTEMPRDDLGSRGQNQRLQQPSSRRYSESPRDLAVQSIVQGTSPDARPWMASGSGASLHFAACAESMRRCHVARHRVIRRRRVCHGETLPAGRVCSDAFQ